MTIFLLTISVLYLLGGLDDLFMDMVFWFKPLRRSLSGEIEAVNVSEEDLRTCPEQWIAILVPAWDESPVIARMLSTNCMQLDYEKYDFFVGTYPNDDATQFEVDKIAYENPRVHKVVCPHPGPTSKADCLNWVVETVRVYEKEHGHRYEIFVMQDAEDVLHSQVLKLFNFLVPRYDMVQVPVLPFERPLHYLTGGVYLDEFAEFHQKNLFSRQAVSGLVPSAGVGTAFGRDACDELADKSSNMLFRVDSLTEDYDFAFRLCESGRRGCVANVWVETEEWRAIRKVIVPSLLSAETPGMWSKERPQTELIATREYFPTKFRDAVRQRTRWMLGISFQGWQHLGWGGSSEVGRKSLWYHLRIGYTLFRDRKGLFSGCLNLVSYGFTFILLCFTLLDLTQGRPWNAHWPRVEFDSKVWFWLVVANLILLANRALQRMICVARVASFKQVLAAPVRMIWATGMDLCSTLQASYRFTKSRLTGEPLKWAKTAHEYPSEELVRSRHRRVGELLLEKRLISPSQLLAALEAQKVEKRPLGELLMRMLAITEEQLQKALAEQHAAK